MNVALLMAFALAAAGDPETRAAGLLEEARKALGVDAAALQNVQVKGELRRVGPDASEMSGTGPISRADEDISRLRRPAASRCAS